MTEPQTGVLAPAEGTRFGWIPDLMDAPAAPRAR